MNELETTKNNLIKFQTDKGWMINRDKVHGPTDTVKFLGVIWSNKERSTPNPIINKVNALPTPQTKKQAQRLIGLFGYWRQHITHLGTASPTTYKIARKSTTFEWVREQQKVFEHLKNQIMTFDHLKFSTERMKLRLEVICDKNYAFWSPWGKDDMHPR